MYRPDEDECLISALNITDQEISEALGIDLNILKDDKDAGELTTLLGPVCTGWWSNNWSK